MIDCEYCGAWLMEHEYSIGESCAGCAHREGYIDMDYELKKIYKENNKTKEDNNYD